MITLYCAGNPPAFLKPDWLRDLRGIWAAEEGGVPYKIRWIDTSKIEQREPAYKAVNPFGAIPAMTDGAFKLFESGAIVTYLCEKARKNIPAAGSEARALYDQWCFAALNTVEPPIFQLLIAAGSGKDTAWAKERAPQLQEQAAGRLATLNGILAERSHLLGDFSGADILMGHVLNFIVDPTLLASHPNVESYHARLRARPAYVRALAAQAGGRNAAVAAQ